MEKSLGLIEVRGLSCAIEAADAMVKAANVVLDELEAARGNGMMTVKVSGDVGAVRAAVEAGKAAAMAYGALVSADVIARPHEATGACFIHYQGKKERPNFYAACPDTEEAENQEEGAPKPSSSPGKTRRTRRPRTAGKAKKSVTPPVSETLETPDTSGTTESETSGPDTVSSGSSEET